MILLIDSHDSFTNNLAHLIKSTTSVNVDIVHNDAIDAKDYEAFYKQAAEKYQCIVIGPGPGHPAIKEDIGIIGWLIKRITQDGPEHAVPILGICLGFQSLCYEFGNEVSRLRNVKHGQIYSVEPTGESGLYLSKEGFDSVRYHSLHVKTPFSSNIEPLAYCNELDISDNDNHFNGDADEKEKEKEKEKRSDDIKGASKILMAMKIRDFPFYGVQYHPESICSQKGKDLVKNFIKIANEYNSKYRRLKCPLTRVCDSTQTMLRNGTSDDSSKGTSKGTFNGSSNGFTHRYQDIQFIKLNLNEKITPIDICDHFYKEDGAANFILLNSASTPGEWSIIGFPTLGKSPVITHSVDDINHVSISTYKSKNKDVQTIKVDRKEGMWSFLEEKLREKFISRDDLKSKIKNYHSREIPFFGGYMGLASYEEGQHVMIKKLLPICRENTTTPDLKLVYVENSLVYDHITKEWFLISLENSDWVKEMSQTLQSITPINIDSVPLTVKDLAKKCDSNLIKFDFPCSESYKAQFEKCQEYLHSGDSYELCLTTQLKIVLPSYIEPWDIYKVLTLHKNPSPFSCFMDFDDCCLISSSPERFLSCKQDGTEKVVELRPIKGTVKNTPDVDIAKATKILKTPKEMGENLMIVDLIRHDLYQFTDDVSVTQLMAVEEYKTVYQLVSVIRGVLPEAPNHFQGLDLLRYSLPPGSMTGAPKRRSVELLQDIEEMQLNVVKGGRRGIYSGIVGYWSITDDSDWSVVIRSIFSYKDDVENSESTNIWRIGAGGAITVLSDCKGEWEEMNLKLTSALQAFR